MTSLAKFAELVANFKDVADFVLVYIEEAHPVESNHFDGIVEVPTHRNLADRISAARYLMDEEGKYLENVRVVVDNMSNTSLAEYAALPERAYLVHEDKIVVEGFLGPFDHMKSLHKIEKWFTKYVKRSTPTQ